MEMKIEKEWVTKAGLVEKFYDEERTKPKSRGYVDSDGKRTGEWTYWRKNGTLRTVSQWDNGTKLEISK